MRWSRSQSKILAFLILLAALTGCESLPGLRVVSEQISSGQEVTSLHAVQSLTMAMADKSGRTDPALVEAATRIENANPYVDVIEVRQAYNQDNQAVFLLNMIFRPPQTDDSQQGRLDAAEAIRRTFELAWQGTMRESENTQILAVTLYSPAEVITLDNGVSYVGVTNVFSTIDRSLAASYLQGTRSLEAFYGLIVDGTLEYSVPDDIQLYDGTPNHPMFMIPTIQTTNR